MTTLVWGTDPHLSDKAPVSRTDDWASTVIGKIDEMGELCEKHDADAAVFGGDIFNIKSPDANPHRLVIRLTKSIRKFPCESFSCVGNHDLKWSDMKFLNEAPLEELFASETFKRLYGPHEHIIGDSPRVKLTGIEYHGKQYDLDKFRFLKKGEADYLVCVAHCLASKSGGSMFEREDVIKYQDLLDLNPEVDVWLFGHWHEDQGITRIDDSKTGPGKWVVNVGSMTRGSLSLDNLERKPKCVVANFSDQEISFLEILLKIQPPEKVFDLERRVAVEAREKVMNTFVDKLEEALGGEHTTDFDKAIETVQDIPDIVRERSLSYLSQAKTKLGL